MISRRSLVVFVLTSTSRFALVTIFAGVLVAGCAAPSQTAEPSQTAKLSTPTQPLAPAAPQTKELPRTSDVAEAAFRREFPAAVLDEIVRPEGFANGDGVEPPLFWVVRHHTGAARDEAQISPDGILLHRQAKLAIGELPPAVAASIAGTSPGGSPATVTRHETMARLAYVELPTPHRSWLATIEKQGKISQLLVKSDGSIQRGGGEEEEDEDDEEDEAGEKEESEKPSASTPGRLTPKEIEVPAEAARAVAAVKKVYAHAIVTDVETVPIDDGTGHFDVLQYEVEFLLDGAEKQTLATPDGIVLRVDRPAAKDTLPEPVSAAIAKESAGGTLKSIVEIEDRGDLRLLALPEPRVVYEAVLEKDGKQSPVRFAADGRPIRAIMPGVQLEEDEDD